MLSRKRKKICLMSLLTGVFLLVLLHRVSNTQQAFQAPNRQEAAAGPEPSKPLPPIESGSMSTQSIRNSQDGSEAEHRSSAAPVVDTPTIVHPSKQDVTVTAANEQTRAILNEYPAYADISKLFTSSEPLSQNPELVSWINQVLTGVIIDPKDNKKHADFVFNMNLDSISGKAMVTFDFTEPNDNFGRYDSKNSSPDKIFRFVRHNKNISVLIGFEEQWYAHLVIDLEGSADRIFGKFYRNDGFIGDIQPNDV
ncbi:MAG TPA: hypothetical protein VE954_09155 [Oligoflexus sp.]|uniref:hypothetical protein n=1 Tax=Oligoflexus sp. TaxID=1971216 RepID=UPI002D5F71DC|nr:hypothetical protein [Oligoflexus sp.]HYX33268.1 hypothetical protein [Oligoflexus sp.]